MPLPVLHGIENCDQVRKARAWLASHQIEFRFRDFRKEPPSRVEIERWLNQVPWDSLVNRRGHTWRNLGAERRAEVTDRVSALDALLAEPTLIRRPVLEHGETLMLGFNEALYSAEFAR